MTLTMAGLFEGYGGLTMAISAVLDARLAWVSEYEPPSKANPRPTQAAARLLAHRHPDVPNLGDITAIDWATTPRVDVLAAGFPCQDVSLAGTRAGLRPDTRSGLWTHTAYAIDRLRPGLVVLENVRGLLSADAACDVEPCSWCLGDGEGRSLRALGAVLGDLGELGYDAQWCGLRASDPPVCAPHERYRVFVVAAPAADADGVGPEWARRARAGWAGSAHHDLAAALHGGEAAADADGDGLAGSSERNLGQEAGQPAPLGGDAAGRVLGWGDYGPAIRRWELTLGRPAPVPTEVGAAGGRVLSPRFVEWMQGLPAGWVTDVPGLTRGDQLRLLGNGVVWQQGAAALRWLLSSSAAGSERAA